MSDQNWIDNLPNDHYILENNTFVYDLGENLDLSLDWLIRDGDNNSDEDDDGILFVIDEEGVLSFKESPDFEAINTLNQPYKVSVKATHQTFPELYDIHLFFNYAI